MSKYKVYITRLLSHEANELLREKCDFDVYSGPGSMPKADLMGIIKDYDAVICDYGNKIDDEIFKAAQPRCKLVATCAVGYDNIDVKAAKRRGIYVTNTPGANHHTVADMAWALMFAVARMIVDTDRFLRAGEYKGFTDTTYMGMNVTGKTLGILGAGQIGQTFGAKAKDLI